MKAFKFWLAFFAASLSAYSPVAWASMDLAQKSAFNKTMREKFNGTFNQVYQKNAHLFDDQSRAVLETWLERHGNQKSSFPQAQIVKDKNGKETVKMILNHGGKTVTVAFTEDNQTDFDFNGTRIAFKDLRNISEVAAKLGKTDSSFATLSKSIEVSELPTAKKSESLSAEEFGRLKPIQRVEYLMLIRQTMESAQDVLNEVVDKQQVSSGFSNENTSSHFVLEAFLSPESAWAAASTVSSGDKCLVAGNISVYEKNKGGRLYCNPFPKSIPTTQPSPVFHQNCDKSGSAPSNARPQGRSNGKGNVACPSLLYEPQSNGRPYCQWSSDQPYFTTSATANCNQMSPLKGVKGSPERLASYKRILQGYFTMNGGDADKIKDCFNNENKVSQKCISLFQPQLDAFHAFKHDVDEVCKTANKKAKDQPLACEKLKERTLELIDFVEKAKNDPRIEVAVPPVNTVDARKEACERSGLTWDEKAEKCVCSDGKTAEYNSSKTQYECPVVMTPVVEEKDECKNEKGEKKKSFKCSPAPWLIAGGILAGLAWLFMSRDKDEKPTVPPSGPETTLPPGLPPPVIGTNPPTTLPPTPTTMPPPPPSPGEGGSGQSPGQTGGGRGAQ